jgi:hypothetical protein
MEEEDLGKSALNVFYWACDERQFKTLGKAFLSASIIIALLEYSPNVLFLLF